MFHICINEDSYSLPGISPKGKNQILLLFSLPYCLSSSYLLACHMDTISKTHQTPFTMIKLPVVDRILN